jgi:hypothetical protein
LIVGSRWRIGILGFGGPARSAPDDAALYDGERPVLNPRTGGPIDRYAEPRII